ncbi:NACHT domain-containing protein [Nonomuraea sp. NPDC049750]|uniref:NACHT domain-containing protein n=1 Tax=Nonomuraea sp. NPDC049750 TaxID=3154738 RepID=UPI0033D69764
MTEIIVALIGLLGVLITAVFGYVQWRKTHRHAVLGKRQAAVAAQSRTRAEEKVLGKQRARLVDRLADDLRHVSLLNLAKPLDLDKLYVQLRIHNQMPLRYVQHEEIQDLRGKDFIDLHLLTRTRQEEKKAEPLTPEEALAKFRRIVVLGDPGAGKTTMLRYLALQAARGQLSGKACLPIFVELRRFVRMEVPDLLDYVDRAWADRYGEQDAATLADHVLTTGEGALLLDGLDEVLGGESRDAANQIYQKVLQEIDRLAARYPNARIAVTCRRAGWRGQLPAFRTLEVLDFDDDQIKEFITHWFESDPSRADGLTRALARSNRIHTLSSNPLLLSLIAIVYESDLELPERRSELYKRTISVLLTEWDAHRDIKRFARFTSDRKRDLLEEIAWHFHRQGLAYFPKDELLLMIAEFLPTIAIDAVEAPHILAEITEQYGLLKEQAHEVYGFLHLTLQEYFAAEVAARLGQSAIDVIRVARHDPWWEEVILLLAGRLHDATPLLLALLSRTAAPSSGEPLAVNDDMFHSDLFLAARCLVGVPRVKAGWLRRGVIEDVKAVMLRSPNAFVYNRAGELLAEICREVELKQEDIPPDRREPLVTVLGLDKRNFVAKVTTPAPGELVAFAELLDRMGLPAGSDPDPKLLAPLAPEWLQRLTPYFAHPDARDALGELIEAAGKEGVAEAVPALRMLLDAAVEDSRADNLLAPCRKALVQLRQIEVDELWALLSTSHTNHEYNLVRELCELTSDGLWRRILGQMTDARTDPYYLDELGRELARTRAPEMVEPILELLGDESLPWIARWPLAEALDRFDTRAALLDLLDNRALHPMMRMGVAATLTVQGHEKFVPMLLAAIRDDALDLAVRTRHPESRYGYIEIYANPLERVLEALSNSTDSTVPSTLLDCFDNAIATEPPTSRNPRIPPKAYQLVHALAKTAPKEITYRLLDLIQRLDPIPNTTHVYNPIRSLRTAFPADLAAHMLSRLRGVSLPVGAASDLAILLETVGDRAGDVATVTQLSEIAADPNPLWDTEAALIALQKVSRRAKIRISTDGTIQERQMP